MRATGRLVHSERDIGELGEIGPFTVNGGRERESVAFTPPRVPRDPGGCVRQYGIIVESVPKSYSYAKPPDQNPRQTASARWRFLWVFGGTFAMAENSSFRPCLFLLRSTSL